MQESEGTNELDNCKTFSKVGRIYNIVDKSLGSTSDFENLMDEF